MFSRSEISLRKWCTFMSLCMLSKIMFEMFVEEALKPTAEGPDLYRPTEVTATIENQVCAPVRKIVFAKTHKTAGSTVASIIDRYSFNHHLSAPVNGFVRNISQFVHFNRTSVSAITELDVFTRHVRYNHKEFDLAIPGAKHVTILRNPVYQFESAFVFYEVADKLNISKFENPMDMFFQKPHEYISQRFYRWETVFNHQLFDLGFDTKLSSSQDAVQFKILQLSNDFDLVMISEYFDESLILLKQLLCW
ncbi:galactosylceramide sulfotransferase-like, partial [Anneissia japonica]|uniref:galactosylceramide sulfotransferase-like n=1 Tax=Anneissia japonica TaxID=1529436 RepID=UPI0014257DF0